MRLDPVHDQDAVRSRGDPVDIAHRPIGEIAQLIGVHTRTDGHREGLLGHAQRAQQADLTLGGRATVRNPMAWTTKGSAPSPRSQSPVVRTTAGLSWMPRLPAVIATVTPGSTRARIFSRAATGCSRDVTDLRSIEVLADRNPSR